MSNDLSAMASTSAVTLRRTDAEDVQQRQIYVRVDGGPTLTLLFGDTVNLQIDAGAHVLKANNTLYWKTVSFTVEAGQTATFTLVNKAGRAAFGFLALLGVGPLALAVKREKDSPVGG
jgi:hypothetical protein